MCCLTPFRAGGAECRLLRPRRPSTAVDERERPTWRAFRRSFSTYAAGLSADVGNGELSSARRGHRRRHDPPQLQPRGRGGLFVVGELRGDLEAGSIFGLVFPEEASGTDVAALYLVEEPFRVLSSRIDRRSA